VRETKRCRHFDSRSNHHAGNRGVMRSRASRKRVITRATVGWSVEETATPRRSSCGQLQEEGAETSSRSHRTGNRAVKGWEIPSRDIIWVPGWCLGSERLGTEIIIWATEW
jgi:hypothetical protein